MPSHPNPLPPSSQSIPKRKKEFKKTKPQKEIQEKLHSHFPGRSSHRTFLARHVSHPSLERVTLRCVGVGVGVAAGGVDADVGFASPAAADAAAAAAGAIVTLRGPRSSSQQAAWSEFK